MEDKETFIDDNNSYEITEKLGCKVIIKDYQDKARKKIIYEFGYLSKKEYNDKHVTVKELLHVVLYHSLLHELVHALGFEADEEMLTWIQDECFSLASKFTAKVQEKGLEAPNFVDDRLFSCYKYYKDCQENLIKQDKDAKI